MFCSFSKKIKESPIKRVEIQQYAKDAKKNEKVLLLPIYAKLSNLTLPINLAIDGTMVLMMESLVMETLIEQRSNTRTNLSWPVSVWLPQANRFFNGRSTNISKSGVFLMVPMTTPIRAGHTVEVNFPRTMPLAKKKGQFARIKSGKVVRVERRNMLKDTNIGIAVQFG